MHGMAGKCRCVGVSTMKFFLSIALLPVVCVCGFSASSPSNTGASSVAATSLLSPGSIERIAQGGVAVEHNWLPPDLVKSLRADAKELFNAGQFQPDGLTNTARSRSEQGFSSNADRQTFRGGADWSSAVGNTAARKEFADRMRQLRAELAAGLNRPTLEPEGTLKHEMTYNWYEPGAKLGRHLDEHHEETKGTKGWRYPTRRSVTWLVYLNDGWTADEGGALRCFPRSDRELSRNAQVGAHQGNLQVGWLKGKDPVFLDCFRPSGGAALYCLTAAKGKEGTKEDEIQILSSSDFDVPRQPIDFTKFMASQYQGSFQQISTSRLDPRFVSADVATNSAPASLAVEESSTMDVVPSAGTLVLFDSVSLPHQVQPVTGRRQRIAATGWYHEESQFVMETY